jgi:DNA topoisomerase-3
VAQQFRDATQQEQSLARGILDALRTNRKSVGKLHTELCGKNGMDRDWFEELIGAMARSWLVRLEDSVFEKDGKQIPFRYASLTRDAEHMDENAPLELRIRETAAFSAKQPGKKNRKKKSAATAKRSDGAAAKKLKAWRRALAAKQSVPAFRIMSDKVLFAIAEKEPRSAAELLAIPGIGIKLVEKYAAQIYRILDESRV